MNEFLINEITYLRLYIVFSFIYFFYNYKSVNNKLSVLFIFLLSIVNELALIYIKYSNLNIGLNTTIYTFLNYIIWFLILFKIATVNKKISFLTIFLFTVFSIINLLFIESSLKFNFNIFSIGAIIYLLFFISIVIKELKNENLDFFLSNKFILIVSPILFFLGFSLIFCFKDRLLLRLNIINNISLFKFISHFVNMVYYSLLNLYVYKESLKVIK
jgi:hypothetical protein